MNFEFPILPAEVAADYQQVRRSHAYPDVGADFTAVARWLSCYGRRSA